MQLAGFKRLLRGCTESTTGDACFEAGMAAYERRDYADAEERLLVALKLAEAFGLEDRRVVTTRNSLAEIYRALGSYDDAVSLSQRALDLREQVLGPTHPDVANSLNTLAELYRAQGRPGDAKDQVEKELPFGRLDRRLDEMRFHLIEAEELMSELSMESKFNTHLSFLTMLRDQGRARADRWLARNFDGTDLRSPVNLAELFC